MRPPRATWTSRPRSPSKGPGRSTVIKQTQVDRVFQIVNSGINVTFENLAIEGGKAVDDGSSGDKPGGSNAEGGGIFNAGGDLLLTGVTVQKNSAVGGNTTAVGHNGLSALGGGVYSNGGTIRLINSAIDNNTATGGNGSTALARARAPASPVPAARPRAAVSTPPTARR